METTTWPQQGWSTWLNEPIVPYDDREITHINLIERVTVTKPTQYLEQPRENRQSPHRERRRRRSSSEGIHKDRALTFERYETGRLKALPQSSFEVEPRRRRRSSSEERIKDRGLSHERHITTERLSGTQSFREVEQKDRRRRRSSEERHITTCKLSETQSSSEEKYRERRRRRSSSEERRRDRALLNERHTTGRITNRRSSSEHANEIRRSRSLSRERRQHCRSELQCLPKDTRHVGTSMHGQLLLQDGSPAPQSTKIGTSKEEKPLDENRNDVDGVSTHDTFTLTEKNKNGNIHGDIHEQEKKPLDPSNEDNDSYKPSRACLTPTSLIYAISVTLACFWCFPIGIYAIYRALQIRPRMEAGDFEGSIRASKSAGFWATIVLVWGTIIVGAVLILVALFS